MYLLPATLILVLVSVGTVHASENPGAAGKLRFSEHLIMDKYAYPYGIASADLDGDGDPDLTSADALPHNCLYWFENDGKGRFTRHFIQKDDPERLERHGIGDIDRDGDPDVVIVKNLNGDLLWFENSGKPRNGQRWKRHVITKGGLPGAYDVAVADLDRDGDLDVAGSGWRLGNQFAWFENDGSPKDGVWTKHLIEAEIAETRTIRAADFDGDGDLDLLGTAPMANQIMWYENSGKPAATRWKKHVIDRPIRPMHGEPVDLDRDGDTDVVMATGMSAPKEAKNSHEVAWYENNPKPGGIAWTKHIICRRFSDAIEAVAADLDADGDTDVVATSWRNPGQVVWFENRGDPKRPWTRHLLKDAWRSANQVIVVDLNGDGRLDIAAVAEHGSYEFRWWRNEGRSAK
jgi:hypothetical protein